MTSDDTERTPAPASVPVSATLRSRWTVPTDVVMRATAGLPAEEQDQLRWMARFGASGNLSLEEAAEKLRKPNGETYSRDTLYQALTGKRTEQGVSLATLAKAIEDFRRRQEETNAQLSSGFIETSLSRRIFAACQAALDWNRMVFVFGESQIGKTAAGSEFQRLHNHGITRMVRMPSGGSIGHFSAELGSSLGINIKLSEYSMRRRILDSFDERSLLIIDEAHQALIAKSHSTGIRTFEFIREIHDRRRCGIVLFGTKVLKEALTQHPVLQQLWKRRAPGAVLQLPAVPPQKDLEKFAEAFGLEPAPDKDIEVSYTSYDAEGNEHRSRYTNNPLKIQQTILKSKDGGFGCWVKLLEDAQRWAKSSGGKMHWGQVLRAYCVALANEATD